MAKVICENCGYQFEPSNNQVTGSAMLAGAVTGALFGSRVGIPGALPGALIGGLLAGVGASKVTTCPCCDETFWV
ncbi:MAG: hypothetical protein ACI8WB_000667 [Phenylobacterium sp.]|jgi:hypothetical protein